MFSLLAHPFLPPRPFSPLTQALKHYFKLLHCYPFSLSFLHGHPKSQSICLLLFEHWILLFLYCLLVHDPSSFTTAFTIVMIPSSLTYSPGFSPKFQIVFSDCRLGTIWVSCRNFKIYMSQTRLSFFYPIFKRKKKSFCLFWPQSGGRIVLTT